MSEYTKNRQSGTHNPPLRPAYMLTKADKPLKWHTTTTYKALKMAFAQKSSPLTSRPPRKHTSHGTLSQRRTYPWH